LKRLLAYEPGTPQSNVVSSLFSLDEVLESKVGGTRPETEEHGNLATKLIRELSRQPSQSESVIRDFRRYRRGTLFACGQILAIRQVSKSSSVQVLDDGVSVQYFRKFEV